MVSRLFDPRSDVGRRYLAYLSSRARVWAERHLDGVAPDYRGDATLERFHFCNVWRELDRYSRWEIENMRGLPLWHQLDIVVVGRMTMVPSSVRLLLGGADRPTLARHRVDCQARKERWYSPALQVTWMKAKDPDGWGYVETFCRQRDSYLEHRDDLVRAVSEADDARGIATALRAVDYVGGFRSYEMATSLTYSEHLPHLHEDQLFHVGPGAIDGLELLTGRRSVERVVFEALRDEVTVELMRDRTVRWIPPEWQGNPHGRVTRKFTMRTLEDSLCEFRKYNTLSGAEGIAKRRKYRRTD